MELRTSEPLVPHQPMVRQLFHRFERVGKGGYGTVYKARSKSEGREYAIKFVEYKSSDADKAWREVLVHSRLRHRNIVKFHSVWLEILSDEYHAGQDFAKASKSSDSVMFTESSDPIGKERNLTPQIADSEGESDDITSLASSGYGSFVQETSESIGNEHTKASRNAETEDIDGSDSGRVVSRSSSQHSTSDQRFCLFITMELCDMDLRTYMDNRTTCDMREAMRMFKEICEGLAHIHQNGFMHRDISPRNVFVSFTGTMLIGDFGLAKSITSNDLTEQAHTPNVGQTWYQSPEKKAGRDYDAKSDVYSMGLILFELLYQMKTVSERRVKLEEASTGLLPEDFVVPERNLVEEMLSHQPDERPTLTEILQRL